MITRHALALGASEAVVVQRAGDQVEVLAGPPGRARVARDHPLAKAMDSGQPLWLGTSAADGLPSDAVVPLLLDGHAIGAIGLAFAPSAPPMGPSQRAIIRTVAGQCAQALDRARLHAVEHEVAEVLQRSLLPRELPGSPGWPPRRATSRAAPTPRRAATGTTSSRSTTTASRSRSATSWGTGPARRPSWASCAVRWRPTCSTGTAPPPRWSASTGSRPASRARRAAPASASRWTGCPASCATPAPGTSRCCSSGPDGTRYAEEGAGTVLAVVGRPAFAEGTATITPGTSVLIYTDGLVERRDEVVDEGLARLAAAAERHREADPEGLADRVIEDVLGGTGPRDDVALVVVRLVPAPLAVTLPAAPASLRTLRRAITAWAIAAGLPDAAVDDLQLAVGEAAANAAEHAYPDTPGTFDAALRRMASGEIAVRVRDRGRWRLAPADPGFRGRGLQVVRAIGRDVRVTADDSGTEVVFRVPDTARPVPPPSRRCPPSTPAARSWSSPGTSTSPPSTRSALASWPRSSGAAAWSSTCGRCGTCPARACGSSPRRPTGRRTSR